MGRIRSCLARVGCLTLLVLGVTFGWLYRDEVAAWWLERTGGAVAVAGAGSAPVEAGTASPDGSGERTERSEGSPAGSEPTTAEAPAPANRARAERPGPTVEAFLAAPLPATVRLDRAGLARLVRSRVEPGLPEGIARPTAVPEDSSLRIEADVNLRRIVGDRIPTVLGRMVGDSARVRARVAPSVPRNGTLRLRILELRAGSVGLPAMTYPWLLTEMGLPLASDDPTAVDLPVGSELDAARVEGGELILVRRAPAPAGAR